MLTANKLEKIMELEDSLRAEYQAQLDAKTAEIESHLKDKEELREQLQATIDKQLETISELSSKAAVNQRAEQLNRELTNRADKLTEEGTELKKRTSAAAHYTELCRKQLGGWRPRSSRLNRFCGRRQTGGEKMDT